MLECIQDRTMIDLSHYYVTTLPYDERVDCGWTVVFVYGQGRVAKREEKKEEEGGGEEVEISDMLNLLLY